MILKTLVSIFFLSVNICKNLVLEKSTLPLSQLYPHAFHSQVERGKGRKRGKAEEKKEEEEKDRSQSIFY